jgi:steroid Delta-isomerase
MPSKEAIQSAVAAYLDGTRAMDANAVAEAFAPDGESNDPVGTPPHKGRGAIRQFIQETMVHTERVVSTPDQLFIAGDSAAFKWSVQLTLKNGRSVTFEGIDVIQVNDQGKIQRLDAYWDPAPVLATLQGSPR